MQLVLTVQSTKSTKADVCDLKVLMETSGAAKREVVLLQKASFEFCLDSFSVCLHPSSSLAHAPCRKGTTPEDKASSPSLHSARRGSQDFARMTNFVRQNLIFALL